MKRILLLFSILLLFTSCVTNYYTVYTDEDAYFQKSINNEYQTVFVPSGTAVYLNSSYQRRGYKKIKYRGKYYWTSGFKYSYSPTNYNSSSYSNSSSNYTPRSTSSYYNSSSSSGKTVNVKGYYRKNGTYVKPHTRSAPRRR